MDTDKDTGYDTDTDIANNLKKSHNSVYYKCRCHVDVGHNTCPTLDTPNLRSVRAS